ncbi:putative pollen-specific leucine-rich repeat extensin-like protein 3 [Iris pallida]|uniref:Pollen-specific leucine-rich repeat extensin-like protein 3 n=1 Tax=Iris pallida TaxID=29817 RepID=A0AAX6E779_IRIPA|nr:putative pollen-specific leucine-rich repeat extensin-like protein 3 [Iris pallida]KAJ6831224.1 putative pollen-specific leucine-rich repeat extensin-like protein 3 [Iris pallida]
MPESRRMSSETGRRRNDARRHLLAIDGGVRRDEWYCGPRGVVGHGRRRGTARIHGKARRAVLLKAVCSRACSGRQGHGSGSAAGLRWWLEECRHRRPQVSARIRYFVSWCSCVQVLDTEDLYGGCKGLDEGNEHGCPGSDPRWTR